MTLKKITKSLLSLLLLFEKLKGSDLVHFFLRMGLTSKYNSEILPHLFKLLLLTGTKCHIISPWFSTILLYKKKKRFVPCFCLLLSAKKIMQYLFTKYLTENWTNLLKMPLLLSFFCNLFDVKLKNQNGTDF